jgi:hypothetical protein
MIEAGKIGRCDQPIRFQENQALPSLKELMTPKNLGILIYSELMPSPDVVLEQVVEAAEKAFERLGLGGTMPERPLKFVPSGDSEKIPRTRASKNNNIAAFLSTEPLTMRTPRQVWNGIKSAYPKQTTESVQTILRNNAGKPGLWIVAGNKYGMPGAVFAAGTKSKSKNKNKNKIATSAAANNLSVPPAPAAAPGEKAQARVFAYIAVYPYSSKADVISAFKASPDPIRENHVGMAIARLRISKKITDKENGPYVALPTAAAVAKPPASAVGIGDGAAAQA